MNFSKMTYFFRLLLPGLVILVIIFWLNPDAMPAAMGATPTIYLRANQVGYLPTESKIAMAFGAGSFQKVKFEIIDLITQKRVWGPQNLGQNLGAYGNFPFHYHLDFSSFQQPGRYKIRITQTPYESLPFSIGESVYAPYHETVLDYIRQQRCGYNPFLDQVCHPRDGRTMYGPMPDSTYLDVRGGWHDAGDYLRYLLTSGNTVGRLLFAFRENKGKYRDALDALGHPFPNGTPDILDEAKWGLDWMFKMHPTPTQLFHQVADDRDHIGFKLPHADSADYGWGKGSYRVVYFANGKPQGLGRYTNTSTGVANIAGRYAAVMALAADIWQNDLHDPHFAAQCLKAGQEVYRLGKQQPGCQEGTPCLAPYRYHEITWADDMEWGAAELFRVTLEKEYLADAKKFARLIHTTSWMGADTARHYEQYPFMNLGHFALYDQVERSFQDTLAAYYRTGIEGVKRRAQLNPYQMGVPFIWCSNNLVAACIMQILLYEKMTGDTQYHSLLLAHRDWLLGRNPWGMTQLVGIPAADGDTPQFPHSAIILETGRQINGGLLDGPVYASIYKSLKGIRLSRPDRLAPFQSDYVVYHDDLWDYSTNEPTLDGTAETAYFLAWFVKNTSGVR
ncbi:glycoside hydrolase family 9 protein [candidate division KSB1 bacterium]|nr:glycoside hydrolase family 9 protein [candidate division KSB1 bacterium]